MEYEQLLSNARWDILRNLAHGRSSATELAKVTKSSLPNVSQQLRLLEAYDLVEYVRDKRSKQGKPQQLYGLKHELCHFTFVRPGLAEKRVFTPGTYHTLVLNVLLLPNLQDHPYLHKFALNTELTANCSIAFLKSNDNDIEVLLVTDQLDLIRQKYSNTFIEHSGRQRKVIAWTHSVHELNDGLARKEPYFENLLKNPVPLHDPKNQFDKIKRKV